MKYSEIAMPAKQAGGSLPKTLLKRSVCLVLVLWGSLAMAQSREGISDEALADLAKRAMSEFNVPGMAIGIIKGGKVLFSKGFGVQNWRT